MGLHIVVCVKQTPAATNIPVDLETGRLKTEGLLYAVNPFDEYAVEEALRLRERVPGSTVTAMSLGPARAEEAVRSALALGCDEGAFLCDAAFDGSDPAATAYLLSLGVRRLSQAKPVSLVLCGKQTNDDESGMVGACLGGWLGWPAAAFVKKVSQASEGGLTLERLVEDGVDTMELPLPAVVSVIKEINEPRLPSLKGKMAAKRASIPRWSAADLGADGGLVGANSGTSEIRTAPPPRRPSGTRIEGATPEEKSAALVARLRDLKFI